MTTASDRLYQLLPVVYRLRDAEQGEMLRALLAIVGEELATVEGDIGKLYENWFIETSDDWVVPYVGDLLAVRGLNVIRSQAFSQRAYVANTLYYRRRKGTILVLEKLAVDVTDWPARAVEFFELLQTTQYLNHRRLFNTTSDLRDTNRINLLDTPFDSLPRTAEVRHINNRRGKYNIPNVGVFLWRLQNYPLRNASPHPASVAGGYGYYLSSIGNPVTPFTGSPDPDLPPEQCFPAPIRLLDFYNDLKTYHDEHGNDPNAPENSRYYGPRRSLQIVIDGNAVRPKDIVCMDLSTWERPQGSQVGIDVRRGRIALGPDRLPVSGVTVSYHYGFSADIGGGPYDRRERMKEIDSGIQEYGVGRAGSGQPYTTLTEALNAWAQDNPPAAVIRVYDSRTYEEKLTFILPESNSLVIDCQSEERPTIVPSGATITVNCPPDPAKSASLTLSGLLLEGSLEVSGKLDLTITDCTLVPGLALDEDGYPLHADQPSVRTPAAANVVDMFVDIERSIVGPLELPKDCQRLLIRDSIVDAPPAKDKTEPARSAIAAGAGKGSDTAAGPATTLERVTVFGEVHVKELSLASESIFVHPVTAERRQEGCVRFSYVPDGSRTPRRYRCQPDLAMTQREKALGVVTLPQAGRDKLAKRMEPRFTSLLYGGAAFAQLAAACADEIKTGAEDGSEMGAFCLLQQPQRLANLQIALDEYLRFGLEAGVFFVT